MLAGEPELAIIGTFETPWGNHVYLWCRWCRDAWCFAPYNRWKRDGARQLVQCPTCNAGRTMRALLDDCAALARWPPAIEKRPETKAEVAPAKAEVAAPPAAAPAPRPAPPPAVDDVHAIPPAIEPEPAPPLAALDEPEPEVAPFMPAIPAPAAPPLCLAPRPRSPRTRQRSRPVG